MVFRVAVLIFVCAMVCMTNFSFFIFCMGLLGCNGVCFDNSIGCMYIHMCRSAYFGAFFFFYWMVFFMDDNGVWVCFSIEWVDLLYNMYVWVLFFFVSFFFFNFSSFFFFCNFVLILSLLFFLFQLDFSATVQDFFFFLSFCVLFP